MQLLQAALGSGRRDLLRLGQDSSGEKCTAGQQFPIMTCWRHCQHPHTALTAAVYTQARGTQKVQDIPHSQEFKSARLHETLLEKWLYCGTRFTCEPLGEDRLGPQNSPVQVSQHEGRLEVHLPVMLSLWFRSDRAQAEK